MWKEALLQKGEEKNRILQGTCKERRNVVQRLYTYYSTNKRHVGKPTHTHTHKHTHTVAMQWPT